MEIVRALGEDLRGYYEAEYVDGTWKVDTGKRVKAQDW